MSLFLILRPYQPTPTCNIQLQCCLHLPLSYNLQMVSHLVQATNYGTRNCNFANLQTRSNLFFLLIPISHVLTSFILKFIYPYFICESYIDLISTIYLHMCWTHHTCIDYLYIMTFWGSKKFIVNNATTIL